METMLSALSALLLATGAITTDDWRLTASDEVSAEAVNLASISTDGSVKTFWSVTVYAVRQPGGQDYTIRNERIDCAAETVEVLSSIGRRVSAGIYFTEGAPVAARPVEADGSGRAKYEAVCNQRFVDDKRFRSSFDFAWLAREGRTGWDSNPR